MDIDENEIFNFASKTLSGIFDLLLNSGIDISDKEIFANTMKRIYGDKYTSDCTYNPYFLFKNIYL